MSSLEALYIFLNKPVDSEMIEYLVSTTTSIIQIKTNNINTTTNTGLATPPQSPNNDSSPSIPSLSTFIRNLIEHSHVQCTTLMTTLIYLNRLKKIIPSNSIGMETTHHRIFLGSLLLAAKFTNDSSPMNKHWTTYTNGLLTLKEVNALEIEIIQYIGWDNLNFKNVDLINSLQYFLDPIKRKLRIKSEEKILRLSQQIHYNPQPSSMTQSSSLPSLISSSSSTSTVSSLMSRTLPRKDSQQSIASSIDSTEPQQQMEVEVKNHLNNSTKSTTDISYSLRPLRLKPSKNSDSNKIPPSSSDIIKRRKSSINLLPISTSSNSVSASNLKHSRKSLHLINLTENKKSNSYNKVNVVNPVDDSNISIIV